MIVKLNYQKLKNIIKTALAFSDAGSEYDYLKRLYNSLIGNLDQKDLNQLHEEGFTVQECSWAVILCLLSKIQGFGVLSSKV